MEPQDYENVSAKVFDNPLLLDEILTYLVDNIDYETSRNMVRTARLVNKSWFETTTSLLKKSVIPAIVLKLDENNSLNESDQVKLNGKCLDQFVARFGSTERLVNSFFPFGLNLKLEYFRAENQQSLIDCLTKLDNEMIELQVEFPKDGGSMPLFFPSFKLPFLRRLVFEFSDQVAQVRENDRGVFRSNENSLWLLQFILNASESIKELFFPETGRPADVVPTDFGFLRLPPSLLFFTSFLHLKSEHLEILFRNQLPNLKYLRLTFNPFDLDQPDNNLVYKILDRFRNTLTVFALLGNKHKLSRFPLMDKLETLFFSRVYFEQEAQQIDLQVVLPNIQSLALYQQTDSSVAKWIQNSRFESVKEFDLGPLQNNELGLEDLNYVCSLSLERIEQVHIAFPNLQVLRLAFNPSDMICLKYVFRNMQNLRDLKIELRVNSGEANKYYFDSIFLGLPVQTVKALREHSSPVNLVQRNQNTEPSILNLTELTCLTLINEERPVERGLIRPESDEMSLLSNLFFNEALLKMPKLAKLNLSGKFQVSSKMKEVWDSQHDRKMTYPTPVTPVRW